MAIGSMAAFMEGLVSESRSTRDTAFNALDAVNRDSRRTGTELGAQVAAAVAAQQAKGAHGAADSADSPDPSGRPAPDPVEANRFAPEDEWELAAPANQPDPPTQPAPAARPSDDDDDDYPPTWLR